MTGDFDKVIALLFPIVIIIIVRICIFAAAIDVVVAGLSLEPHIVGGDCADVK